MNGASQFSIGPCALGCLHELDHIRLSNGSFKRFYDYLERLRRITLTRSTSIRLIIIIESLLREFIACRTN